MSGASGFLRPCRLLRLPIKAAATACVLLWGCMGGTGTDTENGVYVSARVVDTSGEPVRNVTFSVLDLSARADSSVDNPVYDAGILETDDSGIVSFYLKKNGVYMASGKRGDSTLFIDTLRTKLPTSPGTLPPGGLGHPEFLVESPIRATGKLRFHSGLSADSGRVMLRGTRITSSLTDSGTYNLGWLPASAQKTVLTVTYEGRSRETFFVKVSAQGAQLTLHMSDADDGACLADSTVEVVATSTGPGSLASKEDIARLVGKACAHRVGAKVLVLEVNASGKKLARSLGAYVIPSPDAPKMWSGLDTDSAAVPAECIESEKNLATGLTGRATLRLANGDIVVNDFKSGKGCLQ